MTSVDPALDDASSTLKQLLAVLRGADVADVASESGSEGTGTSPRLYSSSSSCTDVDGCSSYGGRECKYYSAREATATSSTRPSTAVPVMPSPWHEQQYDLPSDRGSWYRGHCNDTHEFGLAQMSPSVCSSRLASSVEQPPHRTTCNRESTWDGSDSSQYVTARQSRSRQQTDRRPERRQYSSSSTGQSPRQCDSTAVANSYLHALEVLLGVPVACLSSSDKDDALRGRIQELALKLQGISSLVPPTQEYCGRAHWLEAVSVERNLEQELLHADAELARTAARLQQCEADLLGTQEALQEARTALQQSDRQLTFAKGELLTTRELLQQTRSELDARVEDVQKITSQLSILGSNTKAVELAPRTSAEALQGNTVRCEDHLRHCHEAAATACRDLKQVQQDAERELEDYSNFVRQLADTSGGPTLGRWIDLDAATIIGSGHYGFVLLGEERTSGDRIVVKLQSNRWIDVAAREWAFSSSLGSHPHVLGCKQALLHKDSDHSIERKLEVGFATGALSGRKPRRFPEAYICSTASFMDRGTVQDLIDRRLCSMESLASLVRQIASGLSFLHKQQRTHNDVKPSNVLLQVSPNKDGTIMARLADFGLAEHSTARRRDCDLLAYTAWCTGLSRTFKLVPEGEQRALAISEFRAALPSSLAGVGGRPLADFDDEMCQVVVEVVEGLWQGELTTSEVSENAALQGCDVRIPAPGQAQLELASRDATLRLLESAAGAQSRWKKLHGPLRTTIMEPTWRRSLATTGLACVGASVPRASPACSAASSPSGSPNVAAALHTPVAAFLPLPTLEIELELSGSLSPF